MKFRVFLHRKAVEFLKGLKPQNRRRIAEKVKKLEDFPKAKLDIVKIAGEANTFRLREGKYRVLFKVYEEEKAIIVVKIDLRKRVYR